MMRDKMRTKNVERRVIKCERVESDYKCKREKERERATNDTYYNYKVNN